MLSSLNRLGESVKFWTVDLVRDIWRSRSAVAVCPFDRVPLQNLKNGGFGCPKCGGTESQPALPGEEPPKLKPHRVVGEAVRE